MAMVSFNSIWGILFWVVAFVCAVWLINEVLTTKQKMSKLEKAIWIILAIPLSIIASIIYWLFKKK
jgi:membrane protein DedA with SNARE-associated domain